MSDRILYYISCYKRLILFYRWKSYFVQLVDEIQSKIFASIADKYEVDILSHPIIGREGLLLVKPEYNENFIQELISIGITFRIHSEDVKR